MFRVTERIYNVEGLRVGRVYVIENADGLTLIDTSIQGSVEQIEKELQKIGHTLKEIKRIVITHAHPDHYGSLAELQQKTEAVTFAHHRYESAVIRGEKQPLRPSPEQLHGFTRLMASRIKPGSTPAARVDIELKEGDTLDEVLPGLTVVDTPGHSPGHCSLYQAQQRLLFAGDAIVRMGFNLHLPASMFTPDMEEAKRSIRKLAELEIDILCMGHGKPYIGNAGPVLKAFVQKMK